VVDFDHSWKVVGGFEGRLGTKDSSIRVPATCSRTTPLSWINSEMVRSQAQVKDTMTEVRKDPSGDFNGWRLLMKLG